MSERAEVYYAAYGSNLRRGRLLAYLEGRAPVPGQAPHPGARDPRPPVADRWWNVSRALHFAGRARRWAGGGVAFLDTEDGSGSSHVRLWRLGLDQYEDVLAQECLMEPGSILIDDPTVDAVVAEGRWYGRTLHLGAIDGLPVVTCTWIAPLEHRAPAPAYVEAIMTGFAEGPVAESEARSALAAAAARAAP